MSVHLGPRSHLITIDTRPRPLDAACWPNREPPSYGARPLKHAIQQQIENPLAKEILSGRFGPKDIIHVDVEDGRILFEQVIEAEAA